MQKPPKTLADYIVVAISPLLIMLLVGSLAFFLIQVFYRGAMVHSIRWLMFWFVLAIVLVSRIGIEQGKWHARVYGIALALVTWLYLAYTHGMVVFGTLLLAIPWWCAHQLTIDCTLINEDEDASGEGVLQGLWSRVEKSISPPPPPPRLPPLSSLEAMVAENLAKRRSVKPRPPGRTVVWFSLAALPLFGIGQLFLPADDPHARHIGFTFLAVYLGAALSLLATTSFLGLRRYLRQRSTEMPSSVALAWMKSGVFLATGVLLLALILPRPGANYTWKELTYRIESRQHKANDYALPFNPPGEGDGSPSDVQTERDRKGTYSRKPASGTGGSSPRKNNRTQPNSNSNPDQQSDGGSSSGNQGGARGQGQGDKSDDNGGGNNANGSPTGGPIKVKDVTGPAGSDDSNGNDRPTGANNSTERTGEGNGNRQINAEPSRDGEKANDSQRKQQPKEQKNVSTPDRQLEQEQSADPTPSERQPSHFLSRLLRVLVIIALGALLIWFLVRNRKVISDMFRSLMKAVREFFQKLFAIRWRRKPESSVITPLPPAVLEPFASYENPFVTGKDTAWSPERLLCYTYEAICSWAKELRIAIRPQETPREFCLRLLERFPDFGEDLEQFSFYYTHIAFARRLPDDFEIESIRRLWRYLGDSIPMMASR